MTDLYVSEHAVERYRERIGSALGVDELREVIANLLRPAAALGATRYAIAGVTFCFCQSRAGCAVTTVYEGTLPHQLRGKVPRSELSRKECHRRWRRLGKRAGR